MISTPYNRSRQARYASSPANYGTIPPQGYMPVNPGMPGMMPMGYENYDAVQNQYQSYYQQQPQMYSAPPNQQIDFGYATAPFSYMQQQQQGHNFNPVYSAHIDQYSAYIDQEPIRAPPKPWVRASSASYTQQNHTSFATGQRSVSHSDTVLSTSTTSYVSPSDTPSAATPPPNQVSKPLPVLPQNSITGNNIPFSLPVSLESDLNRLSISTAGSSTSSVTSSSSQGDEHVGDKNNNSQIDRSARMARIYGRSNADIEDPISRHSSPRPFNQPLMKTSISQSALNLSNHAVRNPQLPPALISSGSVASKLPLNIDTDKAVATSDEPITPLVPPSLATIELAGKRSTPSRLARMFGVKSKGGDSNSAPGSSSSSRSGTKMSSRTNSPSFASRMGSRISSRISSRIGSGLSGKDSRVGPYGNSMAANSTTSLLDLSIASEPKELSNDWAEFFPRRTANAIVVEDFMRYGTPKFPIFDIDPNLENSFPQSINPLNPEMRQFVHRGVYYSGEDGEGAGTVDEDGNYLSKPGEQLGFRYNVINELGRGSFGTVLRCRDHRTGRMVAVKVTASRQEIQGQARVEAKMLRSLLVDHKGTPEMHHFLRYIEHFSFKGHLCIATELLGPNLFEMAKRNSFRGLREPTVQYITRQLLEGLEFLSKQHIIHCDLKPENILVSDPEKCQVKIVDFGSGCYERSRVYTYIQSRFYRAPEILLGMPYGPPIDMWSLGTIVAELLIGRPLFHSVDETDQVTLICGAIGIPDPEVMWKCRRAAAFFDMFTGIPLKLVNAKGEERPMPGAYPLRNIMNFCSESAIDFVSQILQWVPEKRLTATRAIYHPFVLSQ